MTTQQQGQQLNDPLKSQKQKQQVTRTRWLVATIALLLIAGGAIFWLRDTQGSVYAILPIVIFTVLGVLVSLFQWLFPVSSNVPDHSVHIIHSPPLEHSQPAQPVPVPIEKAAHRGIVGFPPLADSRTIQQREHVVREVYAKLMQDDIAAIALTGIGGIGKSTLAALIYRYAEDQRHNHTSPFLAETIWLTVDPAVTFADLAGNLFEALSKSSPDLGNLAPQNQAIALFNALNSTDEPRLIVLDQFENLLDWDTGHALTDSPGVGEWLDIINSRPCACRILLTSRPRPVGTREYPPTYLQEYAVGGLEIREGIALLQNRGVSGSENELRTAVSHCAGHAFSLTLLATLMRNHHLDLTKVIKNSALWNGDIATNLLDQIYTQKLNDAQRELLMAFSIYREPVPIEAALAIITKASTGQISPALKTMVTQHLVEAEGGGYYQLHAIIAEYAKSRFDESNQRANEQTLGTAHAEAALYYLQRAATTCPPREKRRKVSDVHDLIEAVWQYCQAEKWQEAYDLMERESIFEGLNSWGTYAILQELCELLLPLDKWDANHLQEAHIYSILGHSYRVLGRIEWAEMPLQRALSKYRELGARSEEGRTLRNLGRVYSDMGKIEQAGEYFEAALEICKEVGDNVGEGEALISSGWVYYTLGQLENARQCYEAALSIYKRMRIYKGESNALNNLGRVYKAHGDKSQAQIYYEQALDINREAGDPIGEGLTLYNLGKLYKDLRQNEQALMYLEQALSKRRWTGYLRGEGSTLRAIGQVYLTLEEATHARKCFEEALRISKVVGDIWSEARYLNDLSRVYSLLGQKAQATGYFRQALDIQRRIGDFVGESSTLYYAGKFFFELRQYNIALSSFLLDKKFLDEVQHPYREEAQSWMEKIQSELGDEQFAALLATVEPHAQEIVDQALSAGIE